ncbi:MAG TPA: methyltransferase domain-containing protein [Solirubrobacteraceae bacterium]|jgi:SAM-dependent methyltransferase|nr:methyltransferase domain-containing protein [Solirubrobacteraceae bacterium]
MELRTLERHWNALGEEDPLWAILSAPDKRGGAWDLEEFLATGPVQVNALLADLRARGIEVGHERALDFGCGIGRLTQSLADHFELCEGVDLAPSMIEQAIRINRRGDRCRFHHNPSPDLSLFGDETFDFALSLLVFQHMEPDLMRGYVAELLRVLRPGGIAYFNVPDHVVVGTDLPRDALQAEIESRWADRAPLAPGEVTRLPLTVINRSPVPWPASAQLKVGNHWLSTGGAVLANDDGRAAIAIDVAAGARVDVELAISVPETPGSYLLEVDVLQEHKGWFATLGSPTLRLGVEVAGPSPNASPGASQEPAADVFVARIEMHVMSRDDMLAAIEAAGGVALEVFEVERCGPSAPSFDYVIGRQVESGTPHRPAEDLPASRAPVPPARAGLWDAIARLDDRADVFAFPLSSRRRWGVATVAARRLLRRALREVLYRQTQFNRSAASVLHEQERQLEQLHHELALHEELLAAANRRIELLERVIERDRGEVQPPTL